MNGSCFISVRSVKLLFISVPSPGVYTAPQIVRLSGRLSHVLHVYPEVRCLLSSHDTYRRVDS